MTTIWSGRHSSFGMSCVQCNNELIAPETSEYRNELERPHVCILALPEMQLPLRVAGHVSGRHQVNERYQDREGYLSVAVSVFVGREARAVLRGARLDFGASLAKALKRLPRLFSSRMLVFAPNFVRSGSAH